MRETKAMLQEKNAVARRDLAHARYELKRWKLGAIFLGCTGFVFGWLAALSW